MQVEYPESKLKQEFAGDELLPSTRRWVDTTSLVKSRVAQGRNNLVADPPTPLDALQSTLSHLNDQSTLSDHGYDQSRISDHRYDQSRISDHLNDLPSADVATTSTVSANDESTSHVSVEVLENRNSSLNRDILNNNDSDLKHSLLNDCSNSDLRKTEYSKNVTELHVTHDRLPQTVRDGIDVTNDASVRQALFSNSESDNAPREICHRNHRNTKDSDHTDADLLPNNDCTSCSPKDDFLEGQDNQNVSLESSLSGESIGQQVKSDCNATKKEESLTMMRGRERRRLLREAYELAMARQELDNKLEVLLNKLVSGNIMKLGDYSEQKMEEVIMEIAQTRDKVVQKRIKNATYIKYNPKVPTNIHKVPSTTTIPNVQS